MEKIKTPKAQQPKWAVQIIYFISLICLGFGLYCLGWRILPAQVNSNQISIPAGVLPASPEGQSFNSFTDYDLVVSWPTWVRFGDTGEIKVRLKADPSLMGSESIEGGAQIVIVELIVTGLPTTPPGFTQATLNPGSSLDLRWDVAGEQEGDFAGKVYISFGFYDENTDELTAIPVAVIDLDTQVKALWGLHTNLVLWLGLVGVIFWGLLFILGYWLSRKQAL